MGDPEILNKAASEYYRDAMKYFTQFGEQLGVQNFIIKGPRKDQPLIMDDWIGYFPRTQFNASSEVAMHHALNQNASPAEWYKKITELDIPADIQSQSASYPEDAKMIKDVLEEAGLPTSLILFGKTKAGKEPVVVLQCVAGETPSEALGRFQVIAHQKLSSMA